MNFCCIFTGCSHLSEEEQKERGGIDLQVSPLVISNHWSTGASVVLGMERVFGASTVFKLLHLVQLKDKRQIYTVRWKKYEPFLPWSLKISEWPVSKQDYLVGFVMFLHCNRPFQMEHFSIFSLHFQCFGSAMLRAAVLSKNILVKPNWAACPAPNNTRIKFNENIMERLEATQPHVSVKILRRPKTEGQKQDSSGGRIQEGGFHVIRIHLMNLNFIYLLVLCLLLTLSCVLAWERERREKDRKKETDVLKRSILDSLRDNIPVSWCTGECLSLASPHSEDKDRVFFFNVTDVVQTKPSVIKEEVAAHVPAPTRRPWPCLHPCRRSSCRPNWGPTQTGWSKRCLSPMSVTDPGWPAGGPSLDPVRGQRSAGQTNRWDASDAVMWRWTA